MVTVSLLGAAVLLCVLIGTPLGIWFGRNQRPCNDALPALDFMQTMPAFVCLIPVIGFFGTGKPPGVLATLLFGNRHLASSQRHEAPHRLWPKAIGGNMNSQASEKLANQAPARAEVAPALRRSARAALLRRLGRVLARSLARCNAGLPRGRTLRSGSFRASATAACALVAAMAVAPAAAQTITLVSNIDQSQDRTGTISLAVEQPQIFTTGSVRDGGEVREVHIRNTATGSDDAYTAAIWTVNSSEDPDTLVANQTILMCLSMVVIASLIGAKGLGQDVLIALQYAAKGQGMLAGLAILFCAMDIDRIVQGHYRRSSSRHRPSH